MNWSALPDLAAVSLLAGAFASVARRSQTYASTIWLTGWLTIALHFAASLFENIPGAWGVFASIVVLASLTWAGILFMWASVPYRVQTSSPWMLASLLAVNTLYFALTTVGTAPGWILDVCALLFGVLPLAIALLSARSFQSPLRWTLIGLCCTLSIYLLLFQHRPGNGIDLAQNGVLFTIYIGCCIHFWYIHRRTTAGGLITIVGFLAWACVFLAAPLMQAFLPAVHVEREVWNLPKFLVAVGMILLLLEDQIAHNEYLALHDHLTGLPNRRLYQDRLASALERARRSHANAALLMIDLDGFKRINDTLGHHVGDLVLHRVAELFASRVRRSDTAARTGGDEFSVILEEPISREDALRVGRSLMQLLNEPLEVGEHTVRIGASFGVAMFPEDASEMESLCIAADLRMYDAKHDGRDHRGPESSRTNHALPRSESDGPAGLQAVD